jgi:hypothetical protein
MTRECCGPIREADSGIDYCPWSLDVEYDCEMCQGEGERVAELAADCERDDG